ncbi:MAG: hypothetical protein PVG07_08930 [Acidobacteriota bacterium]|jgi:hypothetical protein
MADTENKVPRDEDAPPAAPSAEARSEAQTGEFDRDVDISGIVWTGIVLAGVTALSFLLMWWMFEGFKSHKEAQDPRPMPIQEAAEPIEPPGPRLQSTPEEDLRRMREQEEALLNGYSLIEGEEGYARIPVDEALDLALERSFAGGEDGMSSTGEAVEGPGTAAPAGEPPGAGPVDEDAGASNADPASAGAPGHSPESTRSR